MSRGEVAAKNNMSGPFDIYEPRKVAWVGCTFREFSHDMMMLICPHNSVSRLLCTLCTVPRCSNTSFLIEGQTCINNIYFNCTTAVSSKTILP